MITEWFVSADGEIDTRCGFVHKRLAIEQMEIERVLNEAKAAADPTWLVKTWEVVERTV